MVKDKFMGAWFALWIGFAFIVIVPSCFSTKIQTSEIKGITEKIIVRHDNYVNGDTSLTQEQKTLFQTESIELLALVATNEIVSSVALKEKSKGVCQRHDKYVVSDSGLDDLHRKAYLRSTELLCAVIDVGG